MVGCRPIIRVLSEPVVVMTPCLPALHTRPAQVQLLCPEQSLPSPRESANPSPGCTHSLAGKLGIWLPLSRRDFPHILRQECGMHIPPAQDGPCLSWLRGNLLVPTASGIRSFTQMLCAPYVQALWGQGPGWRETASLPVPIVFIGSETSHAS